MQENGSDSGPESDSDGKDSSELEGSTSDGDEDINVHHKEAIWQSQSRDSDSSSDDEADGELEGGNNGGNLGGIVRMQDSKDIATVVDRELISIDSVSIHQNYRRAVTYKGLQGDKDLEALRGEQGSTEDGIPDLAGPDIIEAPILTAIESEVAIEARWSKWKCIPRKQVLDTLNGCLCGEVVDPLELPSDAIIKCKEIGCETEWVTSNPFSMAYIGTHHFG